MKTRLPVFLVFVVCCGIYVNADGISCSASATCTNQCDEVSMSITGDSGCTCTCDGEYVSCEATRKNVDPALPPGADQTIQERVTSRHLRDCDQGGDEGGSGSDGSDKSSDLGWCTGCYDSNGSLTPLGEFFAGNV